MSGGRAWHYDLGHGKKDGNNLQNSHAETLNNLIPSYATCTYLLTIVIIIPTIFCFEAFFPARSLRGSVTKSLVGRLDSPALLGFVTREATTLGSTLLLTGFVVLAITAAALTLKALLSAFPFGGGIAHPLKLRSCTAALLLLLILLASLATIVVSPLLILTRTGGILREEMQVLIFCLAALCSAHLLAFFLIFVLPPGTIVTVLTALVTLLRDK